MINSKVFYEDGTVEVNRYTGHLYLTDDNGIVWEDDDNEEL